MTLYTNDYLEYYLTLVGWIINNGIWDMISDTGLFALPFIIIVAREWIKVRGEGADEGNKGVLSLARIETQLYVGYVVVSLCAVPAISVGFDTLQFDQSRGKQCQVLTPTPSETGWNTTFSSLAGKSAKVPVWWALVHALSKGLNSGAVAAIPCGTDLRQMRMEVDAMRIGNPLLAQEVADFTHDCFGPSRARLFMRQPDIRSIATDQNPFKKTTVIAPKRRSKIIAGEAIHRARRWLQSLVGAEKATDTRSRITPAWFWLATFEIFYYTGIRLNALLCMQLQDIDWDQQLILVRGETEKTHREFRIPIMDGLAPHLRRLLDEAEKAGFAPEDQLFNVNRFSRHYKRREMNSDQVEAMYKKLMEKLGVRMTPHRFRHTLATDLMKQPERNIHLTKNLLNHSNIATTMSYIETDYNHMRDVLHERSLQQGALHLVRRVDESGSPGSRSGQTQPKKNSRERKTREIKLQGVTEPAAGFQTSKAPCSSDLLPPEELFTPTLLFKSMTSGVKTTPATRTSATETVTVYSARASP